MKRIEPDVICAPNPASARAAALALTMTATLVGAIFASSTAGAKIDRIYQPHATGMDTVCMDRKTNTKLACPDVVVIQETRSRAVTTPYERDDFAALDKTFETWRDGGKQHGDGSWELALFIPGLAAGLTSVTADTEKLSAWRKMRPDSVAAQYAQAYAWYFYAVRVKGDDPHAKPPREARAIAADRLGKATALLLQLQPKMNDSPAWHELRIAVLVEQNAIAAARKAFDEAVARFPRFHPLYFAMSNAYKGPAFEQFANVAVKASRQFEGSGMYARLYQRVDYNTAMPFDPERSSLPRWTELRAGYTDLLQRYPASITLATSFASVACRSDDSELYRRMRTAADEYFSVRSFTVVPVEACDKRHGWKPAA